MIGDDFEPDPDAIAPLGWGFLPGAKLRPTIDDLPELPFLKLLRPCDQHRAVTIALVEHFDVVREITPEQLHQRYPVLHRKRLYEVLGNAAIGRIPSHKTGRPRKSA